MANIINKKIGDKSMSPIVDKNISINLFLIFSFKYFVSTVQSNYN